MLKTATILRNAGGTSAAFWLVTVSFLRTRLAALVVIAAVVTAATAPALAAQAHPGCAAKHHGCGQAATILKCCCDGSGQTSDEKGPTQSRVQVAAELAATPALFAVPCSSGLTGRVGRPLAFPPGAKPPDLVTLFAALLI